MMSWKLNRKTCLRCGACVSVCPETALDLKESGLINDEKKCTLCGICAKVCPSKCIEVKK